jgi:hypothetical protein
MSATSVLTKLLKGTIKGKKMLSRADEEPIQKFLDKVPPKKFLSPEQEAAHQKYLEEYNQRAPEDIPGVEEIEDAVKGVNAPKPTPPAAGAEVDESALTPEQIQAYRSKYNITPGDARKGGGVKQRPIDPGMLQRAREKLPEFKDATDRDIINLYTDLGYR